MSANAKLAHRHRALGTSVVTMQSPSSIVLGHDAAFRGMWQRDGRLRTSAQSDARFAGRRGGFAAQVRIDTSGPFRYS
jgi:hypothetical protein